MIVFMQIKQYIKSGFILYLVCMCFSKCTNYEPVEEETEKVKTPVTLTSMRIEPMSEYITLNAIAVTKKNSIRANATG